MNNTFTKCSKTLFQVVTHLRKQLATLESVMLSRPLRMRLYVILPLMTAVVAAPPMISSSFAQQAEFITLKGTVLDNNDSMPLAGVSISDSQRKSLGITDGNGAFSVRVPKGTELRFNFLGYEMYSGTYLANQDRITIRMKPSSNTMNEVVVTALGIKREQKSLGYAVSTVDSTALTNAVSSNWTDALSGKVAGLNLVRNSGPGGSNKIILRGENNLSGDNEA